MENGARGPAAPPLFAAMPIYEYQCPKCQHRFEEWVKLADAHGQEPCPKCGAPAPRIMSHTSFVLKGGGWYVSDYGYRKGIKEDGSAAAAGSGGASGAASSGPAAAAPEASGPKASSAAASGAEASGSGAAAAKGGAAAPAPPPASKPAAAAS
jgi:putative FmdB family regulatory protein